MDNRYLSTRDARSRLNHSVLRYNKKPVYVTVEDNGLMEAKVRNLRGGEPKAVNVNNPLLDSSSPPIGFLNNNYGSFYLSRFPHRRYKAGLTKDNIRVTSLGENIAAEYIIDSEEMADTIEGIYPTFEEALKYSKEIGKPRAFSRSLALDHNLRLWCCTSKVGWLSKKSGEIILLKNFPHGMKRIIEEMTKRDVKIKRLGNVE